VLVVDDNVDARATRLLRVVLRGCRLLRCAGIDATSPATALVKALDSVRGAVRHGHAGPSEPVRAASVYRIGNEEHRMTTTAQPIRRFDNPKPLFPGERWVDLAAGVAAWMATRKNPSLAIRTLGTFVAATLVARASHGHAKMSKVLKLTPIGGGIKRD
jgi:hypothetical protein